MRHSRVQSGAHTGRLEFWSTTSAPKGTRCRTTSGCVHGRHQGIDVWQGTSPAQCTSLLDPPHARFSPKSLVRKLAQPLVNACTRRFSCKNMLRHAYFCMTASFNDLFDATEASLRAPPMVVSVMVKMHSCRRKHVSRCFCMRNASYSAVHLVAGSTTSLVFPPIACKRSLKTGSCSHAESVCSYGACLKNETCAFSEGLTHRCTGAGGVGYEKILDWPPWKEPLPTLAWLTTP